MRSRSVLVSVAVAALFGGGWAASACSPASTGAPTAGDPTSASSKDAADAKDASAAPAASEADAAPAPRPFAGSPAEATQLIGAAVDKKADEVKKCVAEYRVRKKLPRERVSISMGIDQEGRLLGATLPKGKADPTLSDCVQRALTGAAFPRSHSGVISITKSYEEIEQ